MIYRIGSLQENYGKEDPTSVAKVKELYNTLKLEVFSSLFLLNSLYCNLYCVKVWSFRVPSNWKLNASFFLFVFVGCIRRVWEQKLWKINQLHWSSSKHICASSIEIIFGKDIQEAKIRDYLVATRVRSIASKSVCCDAFFCHCYGHHISTSADLRFSHFYPPGLCIAVIFTLRVYVLEVEMYCNNKFVFGYLTFITKLKYFAWRNLKFIYRNLFVLACFYI